MPGASVLIVSITLEIENNDILKHGTDEHSLIYYKCDIVSNEYCD